MLLETLVVVLINQQIYTSRDIEELKVFLPHINLIIIFLSGLVLISIKKLEDNAKKTIEANLLKAHLSQVEDLLKALQIQKHEHSRHI